MSSVALLSCLGVCGWGPLHLLLPRQGDPAAVLERLRRAWRLDHAARAEGAPLDPLAPRLLASLLRSQPDLLPLGAPGPLAAELHPGFRHRLRCRPGQGLLHLRSWDCGDGTPGWRPCGGELRLDAALLGGPTQRPCVGAGLLDGPAWLRATCSGRHAVGDVQRATCSERGGAGEVERAT